MPTMARTAERLGRALFSSIEEKCANHRTLIEKLMNCAATVDAAEPATPSPAPRINPASRATLTEMGMIQMSRE